MEAIDPPPFKFVPGNAAPLTVIEYDEP